MAGNENGDITVPMIGASSGMVALIDAVASSTFRKQGTLISGATRLLI
jgi:hypothetical protein